MKINWKVRAKNKAFWVAAIPTGLLLIQQVLAVFGVAFDYSTLSEQLVAIVGTVFAILALVGVVNDPTTDSLSDSAQAMTYEEPKQD
jgi:phi LC3 family holin